ncbi:AfsR/SARP family transcriptional regulator [Rhizocola hellebori]|nr:BTAD domain-containing putative transcriptional regulator [Rhizocola hellebori]
MDFHVLGPLVAYADGTPVELGRRQERRLLGLLLLETGNPVLIDRLVQLLWEQNAPASARAALHTHAARLRARLAPFGVRLETKDAAYRLDTPRDRVDAHRFTDLVAAATAIQHPVSRAAKLGEALALWRGELLADVVEEDLRERLGSRLIGLRLHAVEEKALADLATGRHGQVVTDLTTLVEQHPTRETMVCLVMTALYRCGRQAEALAVYRSTRDQLVEQLGIEAGPDLQRLHGKILRNDPSLTEPDLSATDGSVAVPRQLPLDVRGFAGRQAELERLDRLVAGQSSLTTVVAVSGMGGVGKTALAVHWSHRVSEAFPDGQLYLDLHGFDPSAAPVTAEEAVRRLLDGLGLAPKHVPAAADAQIALYRSLTATRRLLVVLDNACDTGQVLPLLPSGPACMAIVTSRDRLTGLIASAGAFPLAVPPLALDEARALLALRLDQTRIAQAPEAVDQIIERCASLPLALTMVAAEAAMRTDIPLDHLADGLSAIHHRLDAFGVGDAGVRGVFTWSYQRLSPAAARVFRLLGVHPGPDASLSAIASLAGQPVAQIRPLVDELARLHLANEGSIGRYGLHDLVHEYAAELVEPDPERDVATRRMLDHYLRCGYAAAISSYPTRDRLELPEAMPGVTLADIVDKDSGLAWFAAEYQTLLAVIRSAADTGHDTYVPRLSWTLESYFDSRAANRDWREMDTVAVRAAERCGDLLGQAVAHRSLARVTGRLGLYDDAEKHCRRALELFTELGDPAAQAHSHVAYGFITERLGRLDDTIEHTRHALHLFRQAGHVVGEARAVNNLGWCHAMRGDYEEALGYCRQAVALQQVAGNRTSEALAWDSLGYVHRQRGTFAEAIDCYEHAVALHQADSNQAYEAEAWQTLGEVHVVAGDLPNARKAWLRALAMLRDLDPAEAARLQAQLDSLNHA